MARTPIELTICGFSFTCLPLADADFKDDAAIYAVISVKPDGTFDVLDVGQSGHVDQRIDSHDRRDQWLQNRSAEMIWVGVHPMPTDTFSKMERLGREAKLRYELNPPCGKH